jgi:hypothetical protein
MNIERAFVNVSAVGTVIVVMLLSPSAVIARYAEGACSDGFVEIESGKIGTGENRGY